MFTQGGYRPTRLALDRRSLSLGYRKSPSASALRALNAAMQTGKSLNILGIVPPLAPRIELP